MNKEITETILASGSAMLAGVAETLQTTGAHVYEVLTKQQVLNGTGTLVGVLIFIIIASIFTFKMVKWAKKEMKESSSYDSDIFGVTVLLTGLGYVLLLIFLMVIFSAIFHIINPEYYSIMRIVEQITP